MRKRPVPISPSGTTGRPRIVLPAEPLDLERVHPHLGRREGAVRVVLVDRHGDRLQVLVCLRRSLVRLVDARACKKRRDHLVGRRGGMSRSASSPALALEPLTRQATVRRGGSEQRTAGSRRSPTGSSRSRSRCSCCRSTCRPRARESIWRGRSPRSGRAMPPRDLVHDHRDHLDQPPRDAEAPADRRPLDPRSGTCCCSCASAILPFTTALMAAYLKGSEGETLAAAVYSGSFLVMTPGLRRDQQPRPLPPCRAAGRRGRRARLAT